MSLSQQDKTLKAWLLSLVKDIYEVTSTLFRIMIPTLLVVKALQMMGGVELIGWLLAPVMEMVGLPASMGLIWSATLLTNIYTGLLLFFQQVGSESLSVAQVTVLGSMMLIAHSLPIEVRIAQKAGVRVGITLLVRLLGALLLGLMLHNLYKAGGWLQQPVQLLWRPEVEEHGLLDWLYTQLQSLGMVMLVIALLLTTLKLLRLIRVEQLLQWILRPFLRLMGIGETATTITLVGLTLGLAFGGGLLIKEARAGHVSHRDVFSAMTLLALCHSLIEDTLLILLMGADISGILWLRMLFSFLVIGIMSRFLVHRSERFYHRFLVHRLETG